MYSIIFLYSLVLSHESEARHAQRMIFIAMDVARIL